MDAKTLLLIAGAAYIGYKLVKPKTGKLFNKFIRNSDVYIPDKIHDTFVDEEIAKEWERDHGGALPDSDVYLPGDPVGPDSLKEYVQQFLP